MPKRIFISYRRDDVPGDARGVRDALAAKFGHNAIFMDIDNLLAGQRFDEELAKALGECDVLISIIGPRWFALLKSKSASSERDFVREETAQALARKITVIPVRIGREGNMPSLPPPDDLPDDIRQLVFHQKLDVSHERFSRDIAELVDAISRTRGSTGRRRTAGWAVAGALCIAAAVLSYSGVGGSDLMRSLIFDQPAPAELAVSQSARNIHSEIQRISKDPAATQQAKKLLADVEASVRLKDSTALVEIETQLKRLLRELDAQYVLKILSRAGEPSGVWRQPPSGSTRNYYVIVEPIAQDGRRIKLPVQDEETGQVVTTEKFGMRVSQQTWEDVAADKRDDGIVQRNRFAEKHRGVLALEYLMPYAGGMITTW